jgi:alpha-ribazole phosphatase
MQIILMRHGLTAANMKRLYNGRTDDPLCAEGIAHARASGTDATVTQLYASPMKRALETARIKFPNAEITVYDELREMDFGDFEGAATRSSRTMLRIGPGSTAGERAMPER